VPKAFKFDLQKWFSKNVGSIVICVNFDDLNSSVKALVSKMMKFDRKMFCPGANSIGCHKSKAALIIAINVRGKST